jgi:uncharacterized protein (TIGR03067 family)
MSRQVLAFVTASLAVIAMPAAAVDDKPFKDDLARIQGTWKGVIGGNNVTMIYTISGDSYKLRYVLPDGEDLGDGIVGKFKLDETAKPHKAIDWLDSKIVKNGRNLPDLPAIYAFEGHETLKICNPLVAKPRPTEFFESNGNFLGTVVLKREAKQADPK